MKRGVYLFSRAPNTLTPPPFAARCVLTRRPTRRGTSIEILTSLHFSLPHALVQARIWRGIGHRRVWVESTELPVRSLSGITREKNVTRVIIKRKRA